MAITFWDYNVWSPLVQFGTICMFLIVANMMRRKIPFLRNTLIPTAVIGGFLALAMRSLGWLDFISMSMLSGLTYHAIVIGFIAISLK
ncbi:MAG: hypothetical protein FWE38_05355, partial [Firmicutes bacterium]|nr:hypothetical protein [Bacillota bacterium]